jgi:hypothetical protein
MTLLDLSHAAPPEQPLSVRDQQLPSQAVLLATHLGTTRTKPATTPWELLLQTHLPLARFGPSNPLVVSSLDHYSVTSFLVLSAMCVVCRAEPVPYICLVDSCLSCAGLCCLVLKLCVPTPCSCPLAGLVYACYQ